MARKPDVPLRNGTAGGFDRQPPGNNSKARARNSPDGLTPRFNKAATAKANIKPAASNVQIAALRKKLSRPALTLNRTPLGSVKGSFDASRDRRILNEIKAMQTALAKNRELARKAFQKASLKNLAKESFNRAAGRKM